MVNYHNGKIYKIVCNITGKVYICSTCKPRLCQRLAGHVRSYRLYLKLCKGNKSTSYDILESGNYDIILRRITQKRKIFY